MNALEFRNRIHIKEFNPQYDIVTLDLDYYRSIGESDAYAHSYTNLTYGVGNFVEVMSACLKTYIRYKLWEVDGRS